MLVSETFEKISFIKIRNNSGPNTLFHVVLDLFFEHIILESLTLLLVFIKILLYCDFNWFKYGLHSGKYNEIVSKIAIRFLNISTYQFLAK